MLTVKFDRAQPLGRPLIAGTLELVASPPPPPGAWEPLVPSTPVLPLGVLPVVPSTSPPPPDVLPFSFSFSVSLEPGPGTVTTTVLVGVVIGAPPPNGVPVTAAVFWYEPALWSAGVITCV